MRNAVHRIRIMLAVAAAAVGLSTSAATKTATPPPGLCFTAQATNSTVSLTFDGSGWTLPKVEYSTDAGKTWKPFAIGTDSVTLAKVGAKVYFRGNNPAGFSQGYDNRVRFALSGKIAASGNVMSLIDPTCKSKVIPSEYCFAWLFYACAALTTPPTLPATTLTEGCYDEMFGQCTSLTKAPALPAMTLTDYCYSFMFYGCNSLKAAPALPATTLAKECYYEMFCCCSSLTTAPAVLPAMTLTDYCYYKMFCACESLKAAPELPATTLARQCYCEMFYGCKSLKAAPAVLPAMTLAYDDCYDDMFEYCYSLTSVKMMATVEEGSQFYACNWLDHAAYVYGRGIFIKNAATPLDCFYRGDDGIPKGWTVIDSDAVGQ